MIDFYYVVLYDAITYPKRRENAFVHDVFMF